MKRVEKFPISQLRNDAYLEFCMEFRIVALRYGVAPLKIAALCPVCRCRHGV
jgi:hypothetical protein